MRRLALAVVFLAAACERLPSEEAVRKNFRVHRSEIEMLRAMTMEDGNRWCGDSIAPPCGITILLLDVDATVSPPTYQRVGITARNIPTERLNEYAALANVVLSDSLHIEPSSWGGFEIRVADAGFGGLGETYRYVYDERPWYDPFDSMRSLRSAPQPTHGHVRLEGDWFLHYYAD